MYFAPIVAFLLVFLTTLWLNRLVRSTYITILHLVLLFVTPWLIILVLGRPTFNPEVKNKLVCNQSSFNQSCLVSFEFLFFNADTRKSYGIKDYGLLLPSFVPAALLGVWVAVRSKEKWYKYTLSVLILGGALTLFSPGDLGLISALWVVPTLSVLTSLGFYVFIKILRNSSVSYALRVIVLLNLSLVIYESLRLYQVIIFHKPFLQ